MKYIILLLFAVSLNGATVVNRTTLEVIKSADTPKYSPLAWWINPELPTCEKKYWYAGINRPYCHDQDGRDSVDAYLAAKKATSDSLALEAEKDAYVNDKRVKAVITYISQELNKVKAYVGDSDTLDVDAVKAGIKEKIK